MATTTNPTRIMRRTKKGDLVKFGGGLVLADWEGSDAEGALVPLMAAETEVAKEADDDWPTVEAWDPVILCEVAFPLGAAVSIG